MKMPHLKLTKIPGATSRSTSTGIRKGYRSGLEGQVAEQIQSTGQQVSYEEDKIKYTVPERQASYCPDFKLPKQGGFFYVETKGRFVTADRAKHLLIKKQHPDIDIRFVFSRSRSPIYKGSKTTYAAWCEKHGFQYADKRIPDEWLTEGETDDKTVTATEEDSGSP